jgi:hypothetical protein
MSAATIPVQQATIRQYAKRLQLATIGGQFVQVAEQAIKEKQSHLSYLEALLGAEVEERERNTVALRIKDAHFPKVKTLEEFAFSDAPHLPGHFSWGNRDGQDTFGHRAGGGCLPSEEAGAFYNRSRDGERTDRSQEQE